MSRIRALRSPKAVRLRFVAPGALAVAAGSLAAGPINPPPGPVAPTHKSLTEVEPRTPIGPATTPGTAAAVFRIAQPGSYYLTGNVAGVSGKCGIEIAASGVTVDLNGFDLVGAPGSLDGVRVADNSSLRNIVVANGSVRSWGGRGIDLADFAPLACRVERVHASDNGGVGIMVNDGGVVTGCVAGGNTGGGVLAITGTIAHCSALANGGTGLNCGAGGAITNCSSSQNTGRGIAAEFGSSISNSAATLNEGGGFQVGNACTITACSAMFNSDDGITAQSGCTVTACTARSNEGDGIDAGDGSTITGCTASINRFNGIRVASGCRVALNTCRENGDGAGLFSGIFTEGDRNRIEDNHVTGNDFGIGATGGGHFIVRNYAGGNALNYSLPASGSFVGTIVGNSAGMNSAENANINISN